MNFEEMGEEWNELKQKIFEKLDEDQEKYLSLYLENILSGDYLSAMKYKHTMNMAQTTLDQLTSLRDDEFRRRVFEDD